MLSFLLEYVKVLKGHQNAVEFDCNGLSIVICSNALMDQPSYWNPTSAQPTNSPLPRQKWINSILNNFKPYWKSSRNVEKIKMKTLVDSIIRKRWKLLFKICNYLLTFANYFVAFVFAINKSYLKNAGNLTIMNYNRYGWNIL